MRLIDLTDRDRSCLSDIRRIEVCWDDRLATAIVNRMRVDNMQTDCLRDLLGILLDHEVLEARAIAEKLISGASTQVDTVRQSRRLAAAEALVFHSSDAGWPVIWPTLQQDVKFGREVMEAVAHRTDPYCEDVLKKLTENQLADLYIWHAQEYCFPMQEEMGSDEGTPKERVGELLASIPRHLAQRGSREACEAIEHMIRNLPNHEFLKKVLLVAEEVTRRHTWVPLKPEVILSAVRDQNSCLVQNGDQLLDVILESLQRLQEKLHGETLRSQFLWDCRRDAGPQPKAEHALSDFVKCHLEDDIRDRGIIVNREVEIRSRSGPNSGQRTDIRVDATIPGLTHSGIDSVTVIIEVKGCWNSELLKAMETQLVDRYLRENDRCRHGLYLTGWFNCDAWDPHDYRKNQAQRISLEDAQGCLDAQAADLSCDGRLIKSLVLDTSLR